jgi:hypothetical protein
MERQWTWFRAYMRTSMANTWTQLTWLRRGSSGQRRRWARASLYSKKSAFGCLCKMKGRTVGTYCRYLESPCGWRALWFHNQVCTTSNGPSRTPCKLENAVRITLDNYNAEICTCSSGVEHTVVSTIPDIESQHTSRRRSPAEDVNGQPWVELCIENDED